MRDQSELHPKISVVIPMYNCEQFVPGLFKMFSEQSFTEFEVICVIDGATDGTEEAVKEYCKTDDRFRYIVRENGGAGAARNTGIEEAKGKYVIFSDADDIYDKDYLLKLYNSAESLNTDITVCGNIIFDHQTGEIRQVKSFDKECMFEGEVYSSKRIKRIFRKIGVHISNKLFRLDFIKNNVLKFSETKTSNDLFFSKASVICAGRISVVHDDLLTVRRHINERSISSNRTSSSINALTELQKLYNWMEEKDLLGVFISDYMWLFNVIVNYEMKNGLNPDFIEKFVKIINCDRPWIYLKGEQISIVLNNCLGEKGNEEIKQIEKDISVDEKERIQKYNEVSEFRNNNKRLMQDMAKETSLRLFNRDLDDPESESPYKDHNGEYEIRHASDNFKIIGETMIPEISVIIPMYNCEIFVNDCLDMFSNQTFRDFEVICVIDGATDKTEEKVKDYSKKDPRISYIYQTNGGAGSARNTGMDRAKGRYIIFADADDEYSEDYLKKLYETAINHDAQVVVCSFGPCDTNLQNDMEVLGFNKNSFFENIIYSHSGIDDLFNAIEPRITNRLYNTKFVKENKLRFSETRISNDTFFGCASLSIADRILFVHDSLLTYRVHINADSLTDKRVRFLHEAIIVLKELYNWLKDRSLMDIHGEDYYRRTDHVLYLDGARGATPRFISDFAHMLNAEEPWDRMTSGEILEFLKRSILVEDDIRKEALLSRLSPELIESDEKVLSDYNNCKNRIHMADLLRQVCKERYGRDFENDGNSLTVSHSNDDFFIFDSENTHEIHSGLYGFCITSSGIYTRKDKQLPDISEAEGAFILVKKEGNHVTITQDHIGCFGLFLFRKKNYWAISNSFNDLVDHLKKKYKLEFNKAYADTFLVQSVCISTYKETMIKEIEWLDRRAVITIDVQKKELRSELTSVEEKITPLDTKEGLELLDEWYYKYTEIYHTMIASWPGEIVVDVSGGFDTRMVLATLLGSSVDTNRFVFNSNKNRVEDFKISKKIARTFGFKLNKRFYNNGIIMEQQNKRLTGRLISSCFHKANFGYSTVHNVVQLNFNGFGGGLVRGYGFNISKDSYIKRNTVRKIWNIETDIKRNMASSISVFLDNGFERLKYFYSDEKDITWQMYYSETRRRIHFGMDTVKKLHRRNYTISPLMDKIILKIRETENQCEDPNLLPAIIFTRYCPQLTEFEIEGGRSIAPETIAYAQKLNQMFPLMSKAHQETSDMKRKYCGVNWICHSEKEISYDSDSANCETESIIRRAFLSKTVKSLFCLHYDESIYEEIKKEPSFLTRNYYENWEACIAIAKTISDTQADNSNKYKNIAEFVIRCAEEVSEDEYIETLDQLDKTREKNRCDKKAIEGKDIKPAVSVIIPMFNCEEYVTELLMILKNQSFERFEVICVIDGATDQTEKLVAEFCKTDTRFSYVVQENLGAGAARNAGLELAKGEYIIWIDADDLYSAELLEELYTAAKHTGADMAMCLAEIKDYRTGTEKEKHGFDTDVFPDGEPVKPKDLKVLRRAIDVGIQYKMFKKAFIDKNRLFFSCTHISNDWVFDHAGRISANSIVAVHKKLVTYRKHINRSSITSKRELYLEDSVRVMRELWHWLKNEGYLPEYKDYFISAVDGGMSYNIRFNKNNNRFIKAIAKTINEDEPWKNMDTELLSKSLKLSVFGENRFIKMYEEGIRKTFLSNDEKRDDEQNRQELAEYAFALSTIRSVREMSAEQYGHILKPLPKVSVILPVYNVEKYIGDCIRSLKKQTLKEMEFIFIDDGSTDGSMSVIESFAKEDSRVRVYSNGKNKGAGAARNHGIDISFGEYLAFMDPDDYVEDDFYERLYRKATEGDGHDIAKGCRKEVSVHGVETGSDPGKLNKRIKSRLNEKKPLYTVFSYEHQTALFRHSLFDDGDARYGNTKKAEDVFFLFVICNKTNDIVFDEDSVYYYVQRDGSLLSELSVEKHLLSLESLKDTIYWIKSRRKINQYDHMYFANKLYTRYKSYKSEMEQSPVLKDGYDSFLKELLLITDLTEAPQAVLDSNTKLKDVFEVYGQL